MNQPDPKVRELLRVNYATNADSISFASQVLTIHFQIVLAANHYWNE